MPTHFENLLKHVSDLSSRKILDLGSGRGGFLIEALSQKAKLVVGLEMKMEYIDEAKIKTAEQGFQVEILHGKGEKLPFKNESFGFVNISEVIEHVENPNLVLSEVHRILTPRGKVYLSAPSRFSVRDTHYHLFFINWIPRSIVDKVIAILKSKKDDDGSSGRQKLSEMHYYTFRQILKMCRAVGFEVGDGRLATIKRRFTNPVFTPCILILYYALRPWYFDTFHLILEKK